MSLLVLLILTLSDAGVVKPLRIPFEMPAFEATVPVGQNISVNGMPLSVAAFRTRLQVDEVLEHFAAQFAKAQLFSPPPTPIRGLTLPHLQALDPNRMVSYLVYAWPEASKGSTFVVGVAGLKPKERPQNRESIPSFPGATRTVTFQLEGAVASSFVTTASVEAVASFYRTTLLALGFDEPRPGLFRKGLKTVTAVARSSGAEQTVVVLERSGDGTEINNVKPAQGFAGDGGSEFLRKFGLP